MRHYTNEEYADIHFIYGFCNGNTRLAADEYRRRYPDRKHPGREVFLRVHQRLRDTGSFYTGKRNRAVHHDDEQEEAVLEIVERSPTTSVRRISRQINAPRMQVWRTLHQSGFYPYHCQTV